ncbi:hypothetical protein KSP40_PGU001779 [Platanthera guangdongensis]|uniref:Uncharacterized protein n=1 Tax=Platanthera guangdongensis TaxID=2320717 RepID=A0ABR2MQ60_9ASPA
MKHEAQGRGRSDFFFKLDVYWHIGESNRMESRWRDVKIFKKINTNSHEPRLFECNYL